MAIAMSDCATMNRKKAPKFEHARINIMMVNKIKGKRD